MKRRVLFLLLTTACRCAAGAAMPSAWTGTWKLNPLRSYRPGPTFVVRVNDKGQYTANTGSGDMPYRCDGSEYHTTPLQTHSCVLSGQRQMDAINRTQGKITSKTHDELSADGNVLRVKRTSFADDGTVEVKNLVYARMGRGFGFAGAWRDIDPADIGPEILETKLSGSTLRLSFPKDKQFTDIPLNGTDAPTHGTPAGVSMTLSARVDGEMRILTEKKVDGKVTTDGDLLLSPDGRTLIQRFWRPANPDFKVILVYDKQ